MFLARSLMSWRPGNASEGFLEAVLFIFTEYEPGGGMGTRIRFVLIVFLTPRPRTSADEKRLVREMAEERELPPAMIATLVGRDLCSVCRFLD